MKKTMLHLSVSIPVTYDETKMTETQALDAIQRAAEAAISRAVEGRHLAPDGSYQDYRGPSAVPAPVCPTESPSRPTEVAPGAAAPVQPQEVCPVCEKPLGASHACLPPAPQPQETGAGARGYTSLRAANAVRQKEWDRGDVITLEYRGNELAGETGEACNVVKKLARERLGIRGSRATVQQLAEELADVVICADLVAMHAGIDLDAAVAAKFNATSEKNGLDTRLAPPTTPVLSPQGSSKDSK